MFNEAEGAVIDIALKSLAGKYLHAIALMSADCHRAALKERFATWHGGLSLPQHGKLSDKDNYY